MQQNQADLFDIDINPDLEIETEEDDVELEKFWLFSEIAHSFLNNLNTPENHKQAFEETNFNIEFLQSMGLDNKQIISRIETLIKLNNYIENFDNKKVQGKELKHTQKLAIMGLNNWILRNLNNPELMGHCVVPTWLWKTNIAVLCSEFFDGKSIFIAEDNNWIRNAVESFNKHSESEGSEKKASAYRSEEFKDETMCSTFRWFQKALMQGDLSMKDIWAIFVDEWDVNALSKSRSEILKRLWNELNIPIIALTATEAQATGKILQDTFPWNILHLPMPESLPYCLENGLIPDMVCKDVYIHAELKTTKWALKRGLDDSEINELLESEEWISQVLDLHLDENPGESFILAFRNNYLNDLAIKIAATKWINLERLDNTKTEEEKADIIKRFEAWEISIVWSKMVWRGLNLENCSAVYNSLLTYSPQMFWQLWGRWMRIDPNNSWKVTKFYTILPKSIVTEEWEEAVRNQYPLTSGAFFYKDYYSSEAEQIPTSYRLADVKKEDIRDILTVMHLSKVWRLTWEKYKWKLSLVKEAIKASKPSWYGWVTSLLDTNNRRLLRIVEEIEPEELALETDDYRKENPLNMSRGELEYLDYFSSLEDSESQDSDNIDYSCEENSDFLISEEDQYYINYYKGICDEAWELDIETEKKYTRNLLELKNEDEKNKVVEELLKHSLWVIVEAAISITYRNNTMFKHWSLQVSDLIMEGAVWFKKWVKNFNNEKWKRITKSLLRYALAEMHRYIVVHWRDIIKYSDNAWNEILRKARIEDYLPLEEPGSYKRSNKIIPSLEDPSSMVKILSEGIEKIEEEIYSKREEIESLTWFSLTFNIYSRGNEFKFYPNWNIFETENGRNLSELYIYKNTKNSLEKRWVTKDELTEMLSEIRELSKKAKELAKNLESEKDSIKYIVWEHLSKKAYLNAFEMLNPNEVEDELLSEDLTWESVNKELLRKNVKEVLWGLTWREAKVLRMRYWIGHKDELTREEICYHFDVTKDRIKSIEDKALRKLRHPTRSEHLNSFLDWYGPITETERRIDSQEHIERIACSKRKEDEKFKQEWMTIIRTRHPDYEDNSKPWISSWPSEIILNPNFKSNTQEEVVKEVIEDKDSSKTPKKKTTRKEYIEKRVSEEAEIKKQKKEVFLRLWDEGVINKNTLTPATFEPIIRKWNEENPWEIKLNESVEGLSAVMWWDTKRCTSSAYLKTLFTWEEYVVIRKATETEIVEVLSKADFPSWKWFKHWANGVNAMIEFKWYKIPTSFNTICAKLWCKNKEEVKQKIKDLLNNLD